MSEEDSLYALCDELAALLQIEVDPTMQKPWETVTITVNPNHPEVSVAFWRKLRRVECVLRKVDDTFVYVYIAEFGRLFGTLNNSTPSTRIEHARLANVLQLVVDKARARKKASLTAFYDSITDALERLW